MVTGIIITLIVVIPISILWVRGIDNMKKNYPDYKGGDFLDWDDNKNHTEGNF
jgi:hypothetical protein